MNTPIVALDESGALADENDIVVVVAWVMGVDPRKARQTIARSWRKFTLRKRRDEPRGEFKFHDAEKVDRQRVLRELLAEGVKFGVVIVEKERRVIADTPENYAALLAEAISTVQHYLGTTNLQVILDRHFSTQRQRNRLTNLLIDFLDLTEPPEFAESQTSPLVQAADFVAGAYHTKFGLLSDSQYSDVLEEYVVVQERITWKALRAKWTSEE